MFWYTTGANVLISVFWSRQHPLKKYMLTFLHWIIELNYNSTVIHSNICTRSRISVVLPLWHQRWFVSKWQNSGILISWLLFSSHVTSRCLPVVAKHHRLSTRPPPPHQVHRIEFDWNLAYRREMATRPPGFWRGSPSPGANCQLRRSTWTKQRASSQSRTFSHRVYSWTVGASSTILFA